MTTYQGGQGYKDASNLVTDRRPSLYWERSFTGLGNLNVVTPQAITHDVDVFRDEQYFERFAGGGGFRVLVAGKYAIAHTMFCTATGSGVFVLVGEIFVNSFAVASPAGIASLISISPTDAGYMGMIPLIQLDVNDLISTRAYRGAGGSPIPVATAEPGSWVAAWYLGK